MPVGTSQQKRVYAQRQAGWTYKQIAVAGGFSVSHARELYCRYELHMRARESWLPRQWTPEDVERETQAAYWGIV